MDTEYQASVHGACTASYPAILTFTDVRGLGAAQEVYVQVSEHRGATTVLFHGWYLSCLSKEDDNAKLMWEKPQPWLPSAEVRKACKGRHGKLVIAEVHAGTVINILTGSSKKKRRMRNLPQLDA